MIRIKGLKDKEGSGDHHYFGYFKSRNGKSFSPFRLEEKFKKK